MDVQLRVNQSDVSAEDFSKHYYEGVDRKRHLISRFYMDGATLIWDGNGIAGKEYIQKFFEELPSTYHSILSLDSQPFGIQAPGVPAAFLLNISGLVTIGEERPQPFFQQLIITAEFDKWKIVTDCLRLQESTNM